MFGFVTASTASAGSVINTISDLGSKITAANRNLSAGSLTSITSVARVEPLTIVDNNCLHLEYLPEVLQSLNSIFSGYYLQAVSLVANVGGIEVVKLLDKLNPNRKPDASKFLKDFGREVAATESITAHPRWKLAEESYAWRLPTEFNLRAMAAESAALEADDVPSKSDEKMRKANSEISEKSVMSLQEMTNLSVGKMLNVTIRSNGQEFVMPISVRLIVNELNQRSILQLLGMGSMDSSFTERYWKWREERIDFIRDLILCQDLIRDHKRELMQDRDGVLSEIMLRNKNNKIAGFMTKNPSMAAASNLFVISKETAQELERVHGLDLTNFRDRQKIFEKIYGMIIVVIDREFERVNFYHRDINLPTSMGRSDIKSASKGTGPNVGEILSAYKMGNAPSL